MTQKCGDPVAAASHDASALSDPPLAAKSACRVENEHGRLIVERGSTQYVAHEVLISLGNQLKDLVQSPGNDIVEDEDEEYLQNSVQFLFGYSSIASSLSAFHPSVRDSQILWKTFEENVAPVVMILHKPSLHRLLYKIATNSDYIDRALEAVVFAVYFAAVTSMSPEQCAEEPGQDHSTLLQQYRFATQQALARAGVLQSRNQTVLQAAVLFLTCLRRPGDAEFVWTMTAVAYRLPQGLGLHRDGTHFELSPFEIELRRRLWWSIYLLDSQSSELHAMGTLITESCYDTKLPLNINDLDLSPESTTSPDERIEFTATTFCLIRYEMTVLYRRSFLNAHPSNSEGHPSHLLDERLRQLEEIRTHLQDRYLQYCDTSIPAQWVTATVTRSRAIMVNRASLTGDVQKAIERWIRRDFQKGGITLKTVHHFLEKAALAHGRLGTDWIRELLG